MIGGKIDVLPIVASLIMTLLSCPAGAATQDASRATSDEQQSELCRSALQSAEQKYGTPPGLLGAIAKAESGRWLAGGATLQPWPWALNVDGQGIYLATKDQAVAWARKVVAQGSRATDVGCMQVDLQFHPTAFRTLDEAFDPAANADYAARFLRSLHSATGGNWFIAAGLYHSRSPDLASWYREQITAVGTGLRPARANRTANRLRLVLAGGGVAVINVNRQPSRRPQHLTACQVATILGPYLRSSARSGACAVSGAHEARDGPG